LRCPLFYAIPKSPGIPVCTPKVPTEREQYPTPHSISWTDFSVDIDGNAG
jgi:hypothetical protein